MFSEMFCTKNNTHVNSLSQLSTILFLPTYLVLYKKSECFTSHENYSKSIVVITSNNQTKYSSGIGIDNSIVMESGNNNDEELELEIEMEMGGSNVNGNGGVARSSSRWNPTKEQISMLENLYKQGIKTPSAEEIQQITARLRAYGHIEGKNVFYWFQNHKARQRQKHKQETFAYFNRFLRTPQPFFSAPICPNAMCSPYYIPQAQGEIGFYHPHPKVLVPVGFRRSPSEKVVPTGMHQMQQRISDCCNSHYSNQETLDLFPLQPTGILEGKTTDQVPSLASVSADHSSTDTPSVTASPNHINEDHNHASPLNQPFFDFFTTSGQGSY